MAMNRVQFQPGLSMAEFFDHYASQDQTLLGADHESTVKGGNATSVKLSQFKEVCTLLGNLKTALSGTYHAFDLVKYAHRCLAESQSRFNRRFSLAANLPRLLHAAGVTSPRNSPFIRAAVSCRSSGGTLELIQ